MTTIANSFAAKLAVAFVAIAMMISVVSPAQAAEDSVEDQIAALMATISALQAQLGVAGGEMVSASAVCPYTWTRTLNMGATGADVMKLQQFLNADPATRVSASGAGSVGAETSYYGPATGAAVAKFQEMYRAEILSPLGLVNSTTFFGNSTRAQANALCVSAPVVDPVDTDDADDADDADDSDDSDSKTLGNDEGSVDNLDKVSADESNLEEGLESGLLAFTAEVEGDVEINRVDVYLDSTAAGTQSDNADDYFVGASLWVDGDKVADLDVDDFREETSYASSIDVVTGDTKAYRLRFSSLALVFEDGEEPEFQVALEAVNNIDTTDLTEIWGLDNPSLRYVDGVGFTDTVNDATVEENFSFDAEETAELTIVESDNNPTATTIQVDADDDTDDVTVFMFDIEEENGVDLTIDELTVTVLTGVVADESAVVAEASIWDGSTELDSQSVPLGGVVNFENMGLEIDADETVELTVKLTFNDQGSAYADGETVTVTLTSIDDATDVNGNDEGDMTITGEGSIASETHTLRETGVNVTYVSDTTSVVENNDTISTDDEGKYVLTFEVEAFGDTLYLPFGSDRTATSSVGVTYEIIDDSFAVVGTGTTSAALTNALSANRKTNSYRVSDGSSVTLTSTVEFDPATAGSYAIRVKSINYAITDSATATASQDVSAQEIESGSELI